MSEKWEVVEGYVDSWHSNERRKYLHADGHVDMDIEDACDYLNRLEALVAQIPEVSAIKNDVILESAEKIDRLETANETASKGMAILAKEVREAREANRQLEAANAELQQWKDALLDAGTIHWVLSETNSTDPRKLIQETVGQCVTEALDPRVSETAAKWEAANAELREALEEIRPVAWFGKHAAEEDGMNVAARFERMDALLARQDSSSEPACTHSWFPVGGIHGENWPDSKPLFEICKNDCGAIRENITGLNVVRNRDSSSSGAE